MRKNTLRDLARRIEKTASTQTESPGRVYVEMADGRCGLFDVTPYRFGECFRELENAASYRQVQVFPGYRSVDQDLRPDTIAAELVETGVSLKVAA